MQKVSNKRIQRLNFMKKFNCNEHIKFLKLMKKYKYLYMHAHLHPRIIATEQYLIPGNSHYLRIHGTSWKKHDSNDDKCDHCNE